MTTETDEPIEKIIVRLKKLSNDTLSEFTSLETDSLNKKLALDMAKANNNALFDDLDDPELDFFEQELITQKKIEPDNKKALEEAKKHFFTQLTLLFFEQDNALRSEQSQKLEKEEGQKFNFWANIE